MSSTRDLTENLGAIEAIKSITSIYQEIASFRMRQLRDQVRSTRDFLEGVASVYNHAKTAYIRSVQTRDARNREKIWNSLGFVRRNGKKVYVLLTANEHLYGTLILDVWGHFIDDVKKDGADAVVVGSIGKYLLENERLDTQKKGFDLNDDKPSSSDIKQIIEFISGYEQISVYHGQMETLLHQIPTRSEISGGASADNYTQTKGKKYLFEPSPETILEFFETEVTAALFNQTILEHQLARFASRMVAMDQATENAKEESKKIKRQIGLIRRSISNRKQLQVFAGMGLWHKKEVEWI